MANDNLKLQIAQKAFDSFESLLKDTLIDKATQKSEDEANFAQFIMDQAIQENEKNKLLVEQYGLELPDELQTGNLSEFIANMGDNNYMENMGAYTNQLIQKSESMQEAIKDYEAGVKLSTDLRSKGLFTSPGEKGIAKLTPELELSLNKLGLTDEQKSDPNFMKGFKSLDDVLVQADLLKVDNELQRSAINLKQANNELGAQNLANAQWHHGNAAGTVGSQLFSNFNSVGVNNNKFNFSTLGGWQLNTGAAREDLNTNYENQLKKLERLLTYSPEAYNQISNALIQFSQSLDVEGKNHMYSGFGELGSRVQDVITQIGIIEQQAISEYSAAGFSENGVLTQAGSKQLKKDNPAYAKLLNEAKAYKALGLHYIGEDSVLGQNLLKDKVNIVKYQESLINAELQRQSFEAMTELSPNPYNYQINMPSQINNPTLDNQDFYDINIQNMFINSHTVPVNTGTGIGIVSPNFITDLPIDNSLVSLVNDIDSGNLTPTNKTSEFTPKGVDFIIGDSNLSPNISWASIREDSQKPINVFNQTLASIDLGSQPYWINDLAEEIEKDIYWYNQAIERGRQSDKRVLNLPAHLVDNPRYNDPENTGDVINAKKAYNQLVGKINKFINQINSNYARDLDFERQQAERKAKSLARLDSLRAAGWEPFDWDAGPEKVTLREFFARARKDENPKITER